MKLALKLFLFLFFATNSSFVHAQDFSKINCNKSKIDAKNYINKYFELLDIVCNPNESDENKDDSKYKIKKLFENNNVLVENDLDPTKKTEKTLKISDCLFSIVLVSQFILTDFFDICILR